MKLKKQSLILLLLFWIAIRQAIGEDNEQTDKFDSMKIENRRAGDIFINKRLSCGVIENGGMETIPRTELLEPNFSKQMKRNRKEIVNIDVSRDNKIELLIVVTTSFAHKLGKRLKPYILANIEIASRLFRHPSMKHSIKIEVVKIITIDRNYENEQNLNDLSKLKMEVVLKRFCKWVQMKRSGWNFKFDSALLMDYGKQSRGIVGITYPNSMCSHYSCQVAVYQGLDVGNIIAHELGHQLGAYHDFGNKICRQFESNKMKTLVINTIMAAFYTIEKYPFMWSNCSLHSISAFLRTKASRCLTKQNKTPNLYTHKFILKNRKTYDLNQQCFFADATGFKSGNTDNIGCHYLKCGKHTISTMIADGTKCDRNKHCVAGECLDKHLKLVPIKGGWSKFSPWTKCSRLCGVGIQHSRRLCNNPKPSMGGTMCLGIREKTRYCNTQICSQSSDPRVALCRKNNLVVQISDDYPCKHICKSPNGQVNNKIILPNGNICNRMLSGICYEGHCLESGCGIISGYQSCVKKTGSYNSYKTHKGRANIVTIPANAFNLLVIKNSSRLTPVSRNIYDDTSLMLIFGKKTSITTLERSIDYGSFEVLFSGTGNRVESIQVIGTIGRASIIAVRVNHRNNLWYRTSITYQYNVVE